MLSQNVTAAAAHEFVRSGQLRSRCDPPEGDPRYEAAATARELELAVDGSLPEHVQLLLARSARLLYESITNASAQVTR